MGKDVCSLRHSRGVNMMESSRDPVHNAEATPGMPAHSPVYFRPHRLDDVLCDTPGFLGGKIDPEPVILHGEWLVSGGWVPSSFSRPSVMDCIEAIDGVMYSP